MADLYVWQDFFSYLSNQAPAYVPNTSEPGPYLHSVCVVGYDASAWIIRNSFGSSWRDGTGYRRVAYTAPCGLIGETPAGGKIDANCLRDQRRGQIPLRRSQSGGIAPKPRRCAASGARSRRGSTTDFSFSSAPALACTTSAALGLSARQTRWESSEARRPAHRVCARRSAPASSAGAPARIPRRSRSSDRDRWRRRLPRRHVMQSFMVVA